MASRLASLWNRGLRQIGNGLSTLFVDRMRSIRKTRNYACTSSVFFNDLARATQ